MNTNPGLIGTKLGNTQIFLDDGEVRRVTAIKAGSLRRGGEAYAQTKTATPPFGSASARAATSWSTSRKRAPSPRPQRRGGAAHRA